MCGATVSYEILVPQDDRAKLAISRFATKAACCSCQSAAAGKGHSEKLPFVSPRGSKSHQLRVAVKRVKPILTQIQIKSWRDFLDMEEVLRLVHHPAQPGQRSLGEDNIAFESTTFS
jgi:hypothetical protein